MEIISKVANLKQRLKSAAKQNKIGFVPTMGFLHQGHASLIHEAQSNNSLVVLSIFVNPTQFNQSSDYQSYPKKIEKDFIVAKSLGVDYVFIPDETEIYPNGNNIIIHETQQTQMMEGRFRPNHFDGVLTVLLKLFNIIKPNYVYMGEKDYQQLEVVRTMVSEFFLDIEVIQCPTVRCDRGVALSSRNSRLTPNQYNLAIEFASSLKKAKTNQEIHQKLGDLGLKVDYIEQHGSRRYGAVWLDQVRLIDNVLLE